MLFLHILIPTFNNSYFARRAILSVSPLSKIYPSLVGITVSDDSTHVATSLQIRSLCQEQSVIYKKAHTLNGPLNWESYISVESVYVWILHHDESFSGDYQRMMLTLLEESNPGSSAYIFNSLSNNHSYSAALSSRLVKTLPLTLLYKNFIGSPSCIIFPYHLHMHFDHRLSYMIDSEFYYRIFSICTPKPMGCFCSVDSISNESSITSSLYPNLQNLLSQELSYIHKKHTSSPVVQVVAYVSATCIILLFRMLFIARRQA